MSDKTECLYIVLSSDQDNLSNIDVGAGDVLALTLPAMSLFDGEKVDYLTLGDFANRADSCLDTKNFSKEFNKWMNECDFVIRKEMQVERAFASSAFWMLLRLSGLRYLETVIGEINKRYNRVEIIAYENIGVLPVAQIDWLSLNWMKFGYGIDSVITLLYAGLENVSCRLIQNKKKVNRNQYLKKKIRSLLFRSPEILQRRGMELLSNWGASFIPSNGTVWVVQGGYDIDILKRACKKVDFNNIRSREAQYANLNSNKVSKYQDIRTDIINLTDPFLLEWFPNFNRWLNEWIAQYFDNVVASYPFVFQGIRERMDKEKPSAVVYSIGSEDILDEAIAMVAIEKEIPVFFFKHSGADNLFVEDSVFDDYFERNAYIKRTQFLSSEIEEDSYKNLPNVQCVVTGTLSRPKKINQPKSKNMLYSMGPPTHHTYKEMGRTVTDFERFNFTKQLVDVSEGLGLTLDIKIHPAEAYTGYSFVNDLISRRQTKNIRILYDGSIERIIKNYGLIILDIISTRVLSSVLYMDVPVVLYVPVDFPVNENYFNDLRQRVYVVHDKAELANILDEYSKLELPGLYSDFFAEKYLGMSSHGLALSKVKSIICDG